jgi:hypothetical protein
MGESLIRTGNEYTAAWTADQGRPKEKCGSQSAVEAAECAGQHERHEQNARSEDEYVPLLRRLKLPLRQTSRMQVRDIVKDRIATQDNAAFLLTTLGNRNI